MLRVSIRDLRAHTKSLIDAVGRGEKVLITCHGHVQAELVPFTEHSTAESSAFGLWKDNAKVADVDVFVRNIRKPRHDFD